MSLSDPPREAEDAFWRDQTFTWVSPVYRALRHTFRVRVQAAEEFRPRLERSLAPLIDHTVEQPSRVYSIVDRGTPGAGRYVVYDDDRRTRSSASRFVTAGTIHWLANQGAVTTADPGIVQLHAGAVSRNGVTVVLPAPMDAGKSTTIGGLLRAGYSYFSDEVVEINDQLQVPTTYPKSLALDGTSRSLLSVTTEPFEGAVVEPQWHVPPGTLGATVMTDLPARVELLIFPRYQSDAATSLSPMPGSEATVALSESTFQFTQRAAKGLPVLSDLARQVPAYRLDVSDLDEAVRLVDQRVAALSGS